MWRALYSLVLTIAMPLVFARLAWRGLRNRGYWSGWAQRLGALTFVRGDKPWIWIHAVSVGEAQVAAPLARELLSACPDHQILVTTTTPTGRERVQQTLGSAVVWQYAPYDLPIVINRFLRALAPRVLVVMETEIWPNTVAGCRGLAIPVVLANARLSERSARRYQYIGALMATTLRQVNVIGAQTEADRDRFVSLGADRCVSVTGSIKFDLHLPASVQESGRALRRIWGEGRSVWIAASTHEGEEELVLEAFTKVRERHADSLLVLVPRHPERFARAGVIARKHNFRCAAHSEQPQQCADIDVYIGDTMGDLPTLYAGADVAFVGGSLVPLGGHNMLEPAALGLPVIYGPHLHNFLSIATELCAQGGGQIVENADALAERVKELLGDANFRHAAGERGRQFVEANGGALIRSKLLVLDAMGLADAAE